MKILCRLIDHRWSDWMFVVRDQWFGSLWVRHCERCYKRDVRETD